MHCTNKVLEFTVNWTDRIRVPAGVEVEVASNLPEGDNGPRFWVIGIWFGMTRFDHSQIEQGLLVESQDVEER